MIFFYNFFQRFLSAMFWMWPLSSWKNSNFVYELRLSSGQTWKFRQEKYDWRRSYFESGYFVYIFTVCLFTKICLQFFLDLYSDINNKFMIKSYHIFVMYVVKVFLQLLWWKIIQPMFIIVMPKVLFVKDVENRFLVGMYKKQKCL